MTRRAPLGAALTAVLVVVLGACSPGSGEAPAARGAAAGVTDHADAVASLRAADSSLQAAIGARDAVRTAALYASDATLLPVAEPLVEGRAAIQDEWAKVFGIPGFRNVARLDRVEVAQGGDLGYTQGTYETAMTGTDGQPTTERGKWVTVWRRAAGEPWRVATDIFNTDSPPPDHQESTAHGAATKPGG